MIDQLRLDHEFFMRELGTSVNSMRKLQDASDNEVLSKQFQIVRRSVVEMKTRLAKHNQLEENHVYKWVNVLLDETQLSVLAFGIKREIGIFRPDLRSDLVNDWKLRGKRNAGS